jgi:murein DD-endopeptidase MepM/ murein hydrolase activator NlpD
MQLILLSNKPGTTRSVLVSTRQLAFAIAGAALLVITAATALTYFGLRQLADSGGAAVYGLLNATLLQQPHSLASARLDSMATRIGHLQAETTVLNLRAEGIAALAGLKPGEFRFDKTPGEGGPAPDVSSGWLSMGELDSVLDRLGAQVGLHADYLDALESGVLNYTVRKELLPSMPPVADAQIGSGFGVRTDPFTGQSAMHEGLDFVAAVGTPIMAAGSGVVVYAGFHHEFGNLVEIDHSDGVITRYGHCSRLDVKVGDVVRRGQPIAAVGETGRATGPHLHFEVRYRNVAQNPGKYLRADLRRAPGFARLPVAKPQG